MISSLELRHIIETAFLPTRCVCIVDSSNSLVIQLINPTTQKEELTVTGIDSRSLASSREIARFVAEVKEEMRVRTELPDKLYRRA